jgi:excisionase family DNA binding protein
LAQVSGDWLAIREASHFLGVHIGTVREWADAGVIASYRTPGGHRRFSLSDLQKFLEQRRKSSIKEPTHAESALKRVRVELQRVRGELQAHPHSDWLQPSQTLADTTDRAQQREFGQRLLSFVVAFAEEPSQREQLLTEGRRVAQDYGRTLVASGFSAGNAARATIHFRQLILKTVLEGQLGARTGDEEDARLFQRVSSFIDEILLAIVESYP